MSRTLVTIAALGLGIAVILVGAAALLSGGHIRIPGISQADPGSQIFATREFAWEGGDAIEIEAPATVHFAPGKVARVAIRAPQDVLNRVQLHDGTLEVSNSGFFGNDDHIDVTFSGITLRDITLDGSGKILLGHIDQDRLSVEIRGSGNVEGGGQVDNASFKIEGSGRVRLGQLIVKKAEIEISGSGKVEIAATDEADVTISGSGIVRFPNTPKKLSTQISGSGKVLNGSGKDLEDN